MEVLQGTVVQSSAAAAAATTVCYLQPRRCSASSSRPSVQANLQLKPVGVLVSSRNWNALAGKVPVVSRRSGGGRSSRGVVVMGVEENYAVALATLAKSKNLLEEVYSDVLKLGKYFDNPQVIKFLKNPIADPVKKKDVIRSIVKEEKMQVYTMNFLFVLIDKKRMGVAKDVLEAFENNYYKMTETEVAVVTSAVKIENPQLAEIAKKIQSLSSAKSVKIKNVIDKSVIAGFKVRYGPSASFLVDLTVKTQLDKIAADLASMDSKVPA